MPNGPANLEQPLLDGFPLVTYEVWRGQVERALKGGDFERRLVTRTLEGIDIQPLYTSDSGPVVADASGFPGAPPYRRGGLALGRHAEGWDMRPRYDHPDPAILAREIGDDLARGARSLWLCFDRAARLGTAPFEPPRARGERGVACLGAAQLQALLADVPLERVTVSLDAGANALPLAAYFAQMLKARGLPLRRIEAWLNGDPLGALARDGALPFSLARAEQQLGALAIWARTDAPRMRTVTVSSVPYHDAGAHAVQELAWSLATGVTYLRWLSAAGLEIAEASARIAFSVAVGPDFFMEVAKLRALRQCWAQVVAACGGDADAQRCELHVTTSDRSKTARDPWVNLLRETGETFAAAVGGADAITSSGFDRCIGPSDAFARRIAANTQVILDEESHVTRVADPAGGGYYVERLTDQLAEKAWQRFQTLEAEGGMLQALTSGRIAAELDEVTRVRDAWIETRKQAITGINEFAQLSDDQPRRAEPDWAAVTAARRAALPGAPAPFDARRAVEERGVMAAAIEAAAHGDDLGQIGAALAGPDLAATLPRLAPRRDAQAYEQLRDAADAAAQQTGKRPGVFLCNLGPIAQHKPRAQFASGVFQAGGLLVLDNDGFETPEAAAEAFARSGAALCAICGTDAAYDQSVERLAPLLRARGAKRVVLAGRLGADEARYRAAGITDSIYMGCNVVEILTQLLNSARGVS